jgi:hypothetical protein
VCEVQVAGFWVAATGGPTELGVVPKLGCCDNSLFRVEGCSPEQSCGNALHYITYSTQQGVGTPLGANERLIGGIYVVEAFMRHEVTCVPLEAGSQGKARPLQHFMIEMHGNH